MCRFSSKIWQTEPAEQLHMFLQLHSRRHGHDHLKHKQLENERTDKNPAVNRWSKIIATIIANKQGVQKEQVNRGDNKVQ